MIRYSVIETKRPREIVLLRGIGCIYAKCAFCDYHLDKCADESANFELNRAVLDKVTGIHGELEVINSGSVFELDARTLDYIKTVCRDKGISVLHFEAHWLYRDRIEALRREFSDFSLKLKLGLETFDYFVRENVLHKGIKTTNTDEICRGFDEVNFLFGIKGQTAPSMKRDIELGLERFERICVNIMCPNTTPVLPDGKAIAAFKAEVEPFYRDNARVDILTDNTDFGVGGEEA